MTKEKKGNSPINQPFYPGGIKKLSAFIQQHLEYPESARQQKIEGTVHVDYVIDHLGDVIDTKIISGIGYGCDEEAARVVHLLKFKINQKYRRKVRFNKKIQIHFKLDQSAPIAETSPFKYTIVAKNQNTHSNPIHYNYTVTLK